MTGLYGWKIKKILLEVIEKKKRWLMGWKQALQGCYLTLISVTIGSVQSVRKLKSWIVGGFSMGFR